MTANNTNTQNFGAIPKNIKNIPTSWIKYGEVFCNDRSDQPVFVCSICLRNAESIDVAYTTSDGSVFWRHIQQHHITEECETIDNISAEIQNCRISSDESEVVSYGEINLSMAEPANINCDEMTRNPIKVLEDSCENFTKDNAIKEAGELPNNPSIQKESQEVHKNNSEVGATEVAIETDKESNKFKDQVNSFSNCDYSHHNDKNQTYTIEDDDDNDDVNKNSNYQQLIRLNGDRTVIDYLKHNDMIEISDDEESSEDNIETHSNPAKLLDENTTTWDGAKNFGNYTQITSNYIEEIIPSQTNLIQSVPTLTAFQTNSIQSISTPDTLPCESLTHQRSNTYLNYAQCTEYNRRTNSIQNIPTPLISQTNSHHGIPTPDIFQANSIPGVPTASHMNSAQSVTTAAAFPANSIQSIPTRDKSPCLYLTHQRNNTDLNYFQCTAFHTNSIQNIPTPLISQTNSYQSIQIPIISQTNFVPGIARPDIFQANSIPDIPTSSHTNSVQSVPTPTAFQTQSDVKKAQNILNCDMCNRKYKYVKSLQRHLQLYHRPNVHTKQCEICHIRIFNKEFERHMKTHYSKQINIPSQTKTIQGVPPTTIAFQNNSNQRIPTPSISHSNSNQGIPTPDIFQANSIPDIPTPAEFQANPIQSIPTSLISDRNSYEGIPTPVICQMNLATGIPTPYIFQANSIPGIPTPDTSPGEALANQQNNTNLNYSQCNEHNKTSDSKNPAYPFKVFQCKICGKRIASKQNMISHLNRCHQISPQELETHQNLHNLYDQLSQSDIINPQENLLKCEMCNKKIKSLKALESHHQLYHRPNLRTKQCDICHRRILNQGFKRHMRIHFLKQINNPSQTASVQGIPPTTTAFENNSIQSKPIPVISQTNLISGIPTPDTSPFETLAPPQNNTDVNYFQCIEYKKRKHSKTPSNSVKAFQCNICGKRTVKKRNMKIHLSRLHKCSPQELETHQNLDNLYQQPSQSAQTMLACKLCSIKTKSTKAMEYHHQLYHRPNPYTKQCDICQKRIRNKGFQRHMKIHLAKKIICKYCGRLLKDKCHLRGHINTDHPETNSSSMPIHPQQLGLDLSSYGRPNNTYSMPPRLIYENSYDDFVF